MNAPPIGTEGITPAVAWTGACLLAAAHSAAVGFLRNRVRLGYLIALWLCLGSALGVPTFCLKVLGASSWPLPPKAFGVLVALTPVVVLGGSNVMVCRSAPGASLARLTVRGCGGFLAGLVVWAFGTTLASMFLPTPDWSSPCYLGGFQDPQKKPFQSCLLGVV